MWGCRGRGCALGISPRGRSSSPSLPRRAGWTTRSMNWPGLPPGRSSSPPGPGIRGCWTTCPGSSPAGWSRPGRSGLPWRRPGSGWRDSSPRGWTRSRRRPRPPYRRRGDCSPICTKPKRPTCPTCGPSDTTPPAAFWSWTRWPGGTWSSPKPSGARRKRAPCSGCWTRPRPPWAAGSSAAGWSALCWTRWPSPAGWRRWAGWWTTLWSGRSWSRCCGRSRTWSV